MRVRTMRLPILFAVLATPALAQPVSVSSYTAPDYASPANWLCRPGGTDACAQPIAVTVVLPDGRTTVRSIEAAKAPAVDCFYVYPTVSTDATPNSDMTGDAAETNVARTQFAAFRSVCRTYAPLYRQVTLAALRAALTGKPSTADRAMAYRDVAAAWASYLAGDNGGRGVILIGHSQGSGLIKALIRNEIEGKPAAQRMIAAYIPGNNVLVPTGGDVGGDLKSTPLCRSPGQTGCVVAYVSFRDGGVPPADSRFGRTAEAGMSVACTNPAALGGGRATLDAVLPNASDIVDNATATPPWAKGLVVKTPFVAVPGLLSAECRADDGANVLAIRTDADPNDARTDRIGGDVVYGGQVAQGWGLHLIDVNETLGDLVTLAGRQSKAWLAKRR